MTWIEPKTDWTENDYIVTENDNAYNRIVGNISYLKCLVDELFSGVTDFQVGEEKTHLSLIYAREMNDIENALEILNADTYRLDIGEKQLFKANGRTPLWTEFNRIENACLKLYKMLKAHKNALPRLSITLGGEKGMKV